MKLFTITREYQSTIYIPESYIDSISTAFETIRINFSHPIKITGFNKAKFIVLKVTSEDVEKFKKNIENQNN
jgi:hypothetical protein